MFAVVTSATVFFALFNDLGLSVATVQQHDITHRQVSALFWINVAVGCGLALLSAALSPLIGWFYADYRLTWMMLTLSFLFLCVGLRTQHRAILRRQMRFRAIATIEVGSLALGGIAGVIVAWRGAGYWALVIAQVLTEASNALGLWVVCSWRPQRPARGAQIGSMVAFGGNITANSILSYFIRNTDNLLVGWRWGVAQLGLYSKAYQFLILPLQHVTTPMSMIAVPVLSRLQNDPRRYREYYLKTLLLTVAFAMPFVAFMCVTADKLIPLLLGPQWNGSIPMFRALAPAAFIDTFTVGLGWILVTRGEANRQLRWTFLISGLAIMSFVIGLRWGAVGVGAAFSIVRVCMAVPTLIYCCRHSPLRWTQVAGTAARPALAALVAAVALAALIWRLPPSHHNAIALAAHSLIYAMLYLGTWMLLPNGRQTLREIFQLSKTLWLKPSSRLV